MTRFKGFSTVGRAKPPYTLTDSELVKRDLLNEFYTRRGERAMRPRFGSIIWDILMNPMEEGLEEQIREDVRKIIDRDPRVELLDTSIATMDHTINIRIDLRYTLSNNVDQLYLTYTRDITEGVE